MSELSEQQVELISAYIRQHGVAQENLHDDLLDHVCTSIEHLMDGGASFETSFSETIKLFGPGGLKQVQQQTFELLTEMNETMKKVTFSFGLTSAILLLAGTIFKLMHWPGASIMVVLGAGSLALVYLPLLLWHKLKESEASERLLHVSGFVGLALTTLGVLFKIMHWPGASFILISGLIILSVAYVPIYFYKKYHSSSNKPVTLSTGLVAMTCLILVFALINLRNSAEYERGAVMINEQLSEASSKLAFSNAKLHELTANVQQADEIKKVSKTAFDYIESAKLNLIATSQNVTLEQASAMSLVDLEHKDNLPTPMHFLWEEENSHAYKMDQILLQLDAYRTGMQKVFADQMPLSIAQSLPFDWLADTAQADEWARSHFYRVQLSVILAQFTQMQLEIQQFEAQSLLHVLSQPAASDPPSGS